MSSTTGNKFKVTVFGSSHGEYVGCTVEGIPEGTVIDEKYINEFMARRRPGFADYSSARKEDDIPEISEGIKNRTATGKPLTAIIRNNNIKSESYKQTSKYPRPSHADFPAYIKYGHIPEGGGEFSGRMTAPLCFAGAIALLLLKEKGINIKAHILSVSDIEDTPFSPTIPCKTDIASKAFPVIDDTKGEEMLRIISSVKEQGDSLGGVIECEVTGLPISLGGALFEGLESKISANIFAIPAVKGIEFGLGFAATKEKGSFFNDPYTVKGGKIYTETNNNGGVLGGMATGMPLIFKVAIKPTPTISLPQKTVDLETLTETTVTFGGRHDPCIVPRAVPVTEAVTALSIIDLLL